MKDIRDIVDFVFNQPNPWAICVAVAGVAFYLWRMLKETTNQGHTLKEKRLQTLLSYVDEDLEEKHPFSVEQAFYQYYGKRLSHGEILYLLQTNRPSIVVQDYLWAQAYATFDYSISRPKLRNAKLRIKLRQVVASCIMFPSYILAVISFVGILVSVLARFTLNFTGASAVLFVSFAVLFWLSFLDFRALKATERVVKRISFPNEGVENAPSSGA